MNFIEINTILTNYFIGSWRGLRFFLNYGYFPFTGSRKVGSSVHSGNLTYFSKYFEDVGCETRIRRLTTHAKKCN